MSELQAILFQRDTYNQRQASAFLKRNNLYKIKPFHITKNFIRARLKQPDYNKFYYKTGQLTPHIKCIFEFKK